jgi:hypothetical protein
MSHHIGEKSKDFTRNGVMVGNQSQGHCQTNPFVLVFEQDMLVFEHIREWFDIVFFQYLIVGILLQAGHKEAVRLCPLIKALVFVEPFVKNGGAAFWQAQYFQKCILIGRGCFQANEIRNTFGQVHFGECFDTPFLFAVYGVATSPFQDVLKQSDGCRVEYFNGTGSTSPPISRRCFYSDVW